MKLIEQRKTERLRLSEGRDPKPCLGTRSGTVLLAPCADCGGAGIHRRSCVKYQSSAAITARASMERQARQAMDSMREASGVVA